MDPNPKKKFGFGFGSITVVKKCLVKNRRSNNWKRKKRKFFSWKTFFSVVQIPEHIWTQWEAPFKKNSGQNISIRIRIRKKICGSESEKKFVDPNPKKMNSDPQHCWVPVHMKSLHSYFTFRLFGRPSAPTVSRQILTASKIHTGLAFCAGSLQCRHNLEVITIFKPYKILLSCAEPFLHTGAWLVYCLNNRRIFD
jgi:hypothetical protein